MGVLGKFFGRKDNREKDRPEEPNNGVSTAQGGKKDITRKFVRETARTMDVGKALEEIVPDIKEEMRKASPEQGALWDDYTRVMEAGTKAALAGYEDLLRRTKGKTAEPPQMEAIVSEAEIEMQRKTVEMVQETLEIMRDLPEIYTPADISRTEAELEREQIKLKRYIGAESGKTTIGDSEEVLGDYDGWNQEWIEGYDTPQESALKKIMQKLKSSEYMDEDTIDTIRHEKISSVYKELEQILAKCKQRRRELKTTKDPETNERKPDRFGNATELTPMEFATLKIEELIREGIIEPEIAAKCNIYIGDMGRDDDDDDFVIEDAE